ncbi:MAG: nitroreductase family protein [Gemmatimonadaceae bacterium]|nr:nitroreductase family protein [Gemmatimonadaceae bacterium]
MIMSTETRTHSDHATAALSAAEAAHLRHSVRTYTDQPVSDAQLHALLEATRRAPSAFNTQPWRFVVVRDAALKSDLMAAANNQKQIGGAPVVIALYADMEDTLAHLDEVVHPDLTPEARANTIASFQRSWANKSIEQRAIWANAQANIALGYLLLVARSEGLGTSPMLGFNADKVKALLDIPSHATITALVAVGHPGDDGFRSHRHSLDRIVSFR